MGGLFKKPKVPKPPPPPKPVRMPVESSKNVQKAVARKKAQSLSRTGRQSTILTDMSGSSGQSLGA